MLTGFHLSRGVRDRENVWLDFPVRVTECWPLIGWGRGYDLSIMDQARNLN